MTSYDDLDTCELPERILEATASTARQVYPEPSERDVVLAFLYALLQSPAGGLFDRTTKRTIKKWTKNCGVNEQLLRLMIQIVVNISENDWGPDFPMEDDHGNTGDD